MRLRKAIKKIVAIGTGATMIGATLLGATAADLSDYPSPFVKDGVFNGKIVVGAQAAAQDVIGSIEIATSLQTQSVVETQVSTGGSSATTQLIGDSFKIEKSSDKLNLQELTSDPVEVVTASDMDALEGGTISNEKGTYKYDQFLILSESGVGGFNTTNASVEYTVDSDQSDDPQMYLWFKDNFRVYTYRLSFPTALKTDVDASDDYDDLDNKKIKLLGQEYTIISTENATGTIDLMGGAIQDTLQEYEKKTYNLDGTDYEVEIVAISSSSNVIMKVNGEVTEKKAEGETVKLSDGTEIGIKTILENEGTETGGGDLVTFYLGASKVTLKDGNWASGNTNGVLEVGTDTVNDVVVDIVGSHSSSGATISKIEVSWAAGEDFYVPVGGKLSEQLETDDKDKLFLQNLDFELAAVQMGSPKEIKVQNSASDKYKVAFETKTGGSVSETFFYVSAAYNGASNLSLGKSSSNPMQTTAGVAMAKRTRFSVSNNKFSHLMEVGSFSTSDSKVQLKDIGTGESFDVSVVGAAGTMYLDGYAYPFTASLAGETITFTTFGGDGGGVFYTPEETKITLAIYGNTSVTTASRGVVNVTEYKQESGDVVTETRDNIDIVLHDTGTAKTTVQDVTSTSALNYGVDTWQTTSWDSKDDYSTGLTKYGSLVEWDTSGDQDVITITTGDEAVGEVFITSGVTQVSAAGSTAEGTVTSTQINEIEVGSAVLDTEVADVTADNFISVGGPCANSVSAQLVGVAQKIPECLSGLSLSEGEGVVKLFENGEYVSMLVAGATALDSQRAARVIAKYADYTDTFAGMEVSVTGTSLSDITVSVPAPMADDTADEMADDAAE